MIRCGCFVPWPPRILPRALCACATFLCGSRSFLTYGNQRASRFRLFLHLVFGSGIFIVHQYAIIEGARVRLGPTAAEFECYEEFGSLMDYLSRFLKFKQ